MAEPGTAGVPGQVAPLDLVATLRRAGCVFAEDEARLLLARARTADELAAAVARRTAGEPLEQVLGWAQFCGLRVAVRPGVFVPRRRTELLVRLAALVARSAGHSRAPVVLDLCCGTGAIGLALADRIGPIDLTAVDLEPAAVQCARANLEPVGGAVHEGDLYGPLPGAQRGRVDLVLASPPYVPTAAIALMPPEARLYEPSMALDGGPDGLALLRRLAAGAREWLAPDGHLMVELSAGQRADALAATSRYGLTARVIRSESLDATVLLATPLHP
jgi:release factor glutamine methyltransferase